MKPQLGIGLIGHKFMGKAHSHALHDVGFFFELDCNPVREVLCGTEDDLEETAQRYGWSRCTRDWREVVADPAVSVVDICSPGFLHVEMAVEAARHGKHVMCEKPLANSFAEARAMHEAVCAAGVKHVVNFNYRRLPAVQLAKRFVQEGRLGEIYQFRATYNQDWPLSPDFPHVWRFDKPLAGAGSMADKGSHVVDLARFLVGDFDSVSATSAIFVAERPAGGERKPVTTDDAAVFIARFSGGALGLFGTNRMSAGHKNALSFEINGSRGSVIFDLERLNELQVYFVDEDAAAAGFRTVMVTDASHPYIRQWWPPGHIIGWEHGFVHQYYEFLQAIAKDLPTMPDFGDGMRAQQVLEAVQRAAEERRWVEIKEIR